VWQYLNNEHFSLPTNRALRQRTAREFLVALPIVLLEVTATVVGWHSQQLTAQGKLSPSATIGEKAVVADPLKALGGNVDQEAANKIPGGGGDGVGVVVFAVVRSRGSLPSLPGDEYGSGRDYHAVGIACDIAENLLRSVERSFGVDDPFGAPERCEIASEGLRRPQRFQGGKELQVAGVKGLLEGLQEQATEQPTQHL